MAEFRMSGTEIIRPWAAGYPVPLNPSSCIARADSALKRYTELGVSMHPQNRLRTAREFLSQFVETDNPISDTSEGFLRHITEAIQTCFEQYLIARSTGPRDRPANHELLDKVVLGLKGAETSDADANSVGRDTQFELLVRALFVMGGVATQIAEPDLRFTLGAHQLGIAAKRVKGISVLPARFKEAVKQIEKSGIRGFVAVNTDLLIRDMKLAGQDGGSGHEFDRRLEVLHRLDDQYSGNPAILGRIAIGTDAIWHLGGERPVAEFRSFRQIRAYPADGREAEALTYFFDRLSSNIESRMQRL